MIQGNTKFYTSAFKRGQHIYVRLVDAVTGERTMQKIDCKPYLFMIASPGAQVDARGQRNEPLTRVDFDNVYEFEQFMDRYTGVEGMKLYGCRDVLVQFLANEYKAEVNYNFLKIRGGMLDIEVNSNDFELDEEGKISKVIKGPFPEPAEALYPINSIDYYDTQSKTHVALGLEWAENSKGQKVHLGTYVQDKSCAKTGKLSILYKGFETEADLLKFFLDLIGAMGPEYLSGWNSNTFDMTYMVNRIKKVLGPKEANRLSPWGMIRERKFVGKFGREESEYTIYGVSLLDYKDLVDKHAYVELANKKLNTAGEHFLGETKMDYDQQQGLAGLYFLKYQDHITYNIQDVELIVRLEAKLKFLELTYTLAYMFHCDPGETLGTVSPWSCMSYWKLNGRNEQPELRPVFDGDIEYLGGYVEEPVPGRYRWIASIDAQSLYPHNIMQFNLGVETLVDEDTSWTIRMELVEELKRAEQTPYIVRLTRAIANRELINDFYWEEIFEFETLKRHKVLMAPNCTFYTYERQSLFSEFCEEIYTGRSKVKKLMLQKEQELENIKHTLSPQEIFARESEITALHNKQQAFKIAMNSLYGALANKWFREYFNINIAEAITSAGQNGVRFISHRLNMWLDEKCGTKGYKYAFYNDTDSVYVTFDKLVNMHFTDEQQEKEPTKVIEWMDNLIKTELDDKLISWAEELAKSLNCQWNKLIFKREALASDGVWCAKKRYAMMVYDNEGVKFKEPILKFTGLEAKKSNYPAFCRGWMKECYKLAMTKGEEAVQKRIAEVRKLYYAMAPHQIASPSGVSEVEKYMDGHGGFVKGTPINSKAAINHNAIVQRKGLNVPLVGQSDKILMLPLKGTTIDVIGFQEFLPPEFQLDKFIDHKSAFEKAFLSPIQNFITPLGWTTTPVAKLGAFFV
ncbi:gp43 DNA polymerase [Delftia phage PhiW-14]|uniref:DNA-directed DNA polymerase n=1 Tax=Delftia phage PhiW-14 TaxID=665032 RepID=C9DG06_BPW14|nr:DNA polymerase [Delftia phage PhiW-14]ACV50057.1 gp43 DNA polymerase [Delftia phage PhiW-14]